MYGFVRSIKCEYVDLADFEEEEIVEWTGSFKTSPVVGLDFWLWSRTYDDIDILKSETPDKLPRIESIEVTYSEEYFYGYQLNYAGIDTEFHM